jgi:hypothetical protein
MSNRFQHIRSFFSNISQNSIYLRGIEQKLLHLSMERIRTDLRYQDKRCLIPYGYKIYSQNDEDGIIREIFNRIGVTNKIFVEFGAGNGFENNTYALLFDGWKGLWIDSSKKLCKHVQKNLKNTIKEGTLSVKNAFITKENINELIVSQITEEKIDLLSIDIDGNDFHIFDSITCINPRVIVIEFNAKFPPPIVYCMNYDKSHIWNGDDNFGASLKFLEIELNKRDYYLVGCSIIGINAFFVKKDLVKNIFMEPFTAESHYEPARYYLGSSSSGHKSSFRTLENSLKNHSR